MQPDSLRVSVEGCGPVCLERRSAQTDELSFVYGNAKGGLKVVPSFCVVMCHDLFVALFKDVKIELPNSSTVRRQ